MRLKRIYLEAKNLFLEYIALPVCDAILQWQAPKTMQASHQTLLVKLDVIGDYLLFRNCLPYWSEWLRKEGHEVVLLGNPIWKNLFEAWDKQWVDRVIWVDRLKLTRNPTYRYRCIRRLQKQGYSQIIHLPVHGLYRIEILSQLLGKDPYFTSYGSASSGLNASLIERAKMARMHHNLCDLESPLALYRLPLDEMHAFDANVFILRHFTGMVDEVLLEVPIALSQPTNKMKLALFAGSGLAFRRWPREFYSKVAQHFLANGWEVVLPGSMAESGIAAQIIRELPDGLQQYATNACGKYSLTETAKILSECQLFIGNETGITHLAAIINLPTLSLTNLHHIGLFVPYPERFGKKLKVLTAADQAADGLDSASFGSLRKNHGAYPLQEISPERVISEAEKLLSLYAR